jgi:hypothetical protein
MAYSIVLKKEEEDIDLTTAYSSTRDILEVTGDIIAYFFTAFPSSLQASRSLFHELTALLEGPLYGNSAFGCCQESQSRVSRRCSAV